MRERASIASLPAVYPRSLLLANLPLLLVARDQSMADALVSVVLRGNVWNGFSPLTFVSYNKQHLFILQP